MPEKLRSLIPKGGDDRVYTPDDTAKAIVEHFAPSGRLMEPCAGKGAFVRAMEPYGTVTTCEIDEGTDFLAREFPTLQHEFMDWIITNPPYSKFRDFLNKSMGTAHNVVFLSPVNHFFLKARMRDIAGWQFGFVEIWNMKTPAKPWPQSGFQLAAVHLRRGHTGPTKISHRY